MDDSKDRLFMGCRHECRTISASKEKMVLEGPLFTAGKVNLNGWGIPLDHAETFAASLAGKPLRYCPDGVTIGDVPGAHQCDAENDQASIKGSFEKVFSNGLDDKGRPIYYARAIVTDPATIEGIRSGAVPSSWSVFGRGKKIEATGMVPTAVGHAGAFVDEPAYNEAAYMIMASRNDPDRFLQLYKHQPKQASNNDFSGDSNRMTDNEQKNEKGQPPAAGAANPGNGDVKNTEATQPRGDVVSREEYEAKIKELEDLVAKAKTEASVETRDLIQRETLAKDTAQLMVSAGVLKQEEAAAEVKSLITLSAERLQTEKTRMQTVVDKLAASAEEAKKLSASRMPAYGSPAEAAPLSPAGMDFLKNRMGLDEADITKYAKNTTRSVKNLNGGGK